MDSMDTPRAAVDVEAKIAQIKVHMPNTYASIQEKARHIGGQAYELVRRGLRGERNCFYAIEGGRVVGTTFDASHPEISLVALSMVDLGVDSCVTIWPVWTRPWEINRGTH
ncbi:MAG: hypothetical protein K2Q11_10255 [Burkholderiaceae bacterium]|nr:hypothetical protein [Burkholderiaceae bacterium]